MPLSTDSIKKKWPHCTETKSYVYYVQYLHCGSLMVLLSHLLKLSHWMFFGRVLKHCLQVGSWWHFGRKVYETVCLFTTPWDGVSSSDLVGVSNCLLRAMKQYLLAVCSSQSDSYELLLVTPLAFSNLALAHLGGTLLIVPGESGVEVFLICALHWSLWVARVCCCWSKLLVTPLPCCSLHEWYHALSDVLLPFQGGESTVFAARLPDWWWWSWSFHAAWFTVGIIVFKNISLWEDVLVL